jgi:hypothetical protein
MHIDKSLDDYVPLRDIAIKDLVVLIFMKPNSLHLDPYLI